MNSKRSKAQSSVSPSSTGHYVPLEMPTPSSASSKASKLEVPDYESIGIFLESLNAWLNGYFFSKLSLENTQLPPPPRLENTELFDVCSSLRLTIANVREQAMKKISSSDFKLKEIPEKIKSSPHTKSRNNLKIDSSEDKKLQQILDNTIKEAKKKGASISAFKITTSEKLEEVCNAYLNIINENIIAKNKVKELEGYLETTKTRRIDESVNLNKSKQENENSVLQAVYPLVCRVQSLQEKKQFYSLLYRHYERFLRHEEEEIRKLLDASKEKEKRKTRLRIIMLTVFGAITIKNLLNTDEKIILRGIKVKLIDPSLITSTKSLSSKTLPNIISQIHKNIGGSTKQRGTLNSLISSSISVFQKFMNDIKTVLTILLKNNMEQKEAVITLTQNIKELEEERDELEGALTRTVEYTKNLEEEIIEITGDPECLRQIGEDTEMCMELESHKKALKGLTSQYNQLEHKMDDVSRKYEDLKKSYEEKSRKLQELEKNKGN